MVPRYHAGSYLYHSFSPPLLVIFPHSAIPLGEHPVVTWYPFSVLLVTLHVIMKFGWFEVAALTAASVVNAKVCFTILYGAIVLSRISFLTLSTPNRMISRTPLLSTLPRGQMVRVNGRKCTSALWT